MKLFASIVFDQIVEERERASSLETASKWVCEGKKKERTQSTVAKWTRRREEEKKSEKAERPNLWVTELGAQTEGGLQRSFYTISLLDAFHRKMTTEEIGK